MSGKKVPHIRKKTTDSVINIRLSGDVKAALMEVSSRYGMSMSEFVRALTLAEVRNWQGEEWRRKVEDAVAEEKAG